MEAPSQTDGTDLREALNAASPAPVGTTLETSAPVGKTLETIEPGGTTLETAEPVGKTLETTEPVGTSSEKPAAADTTLETTATVGTILETTEMFSSLKQHPCKQETRSFSSREEQKDAQLGKTSRRRSGEKHLQRFVLYIQINHKIRALPTTP